jgi:hypothetical protein
MYWCMQAYLKSLNLDAKTIATNRLNAELSNAPYDAITCDESGYYRTLAHLPVSNRNAILADAYRAMVRHVFVTLDSKFKTRWPKSTANKRKVQRLLVKYFFANARASDACLGLIHAESRAQFTITRPRA